MSPVPASSSPDPTRHAADTAPAPLPYATPAGYGGATPRKRRWSRRDFDAVMLLMTLPLAVPVAGWLLFPPLGRASESANRVKCAANLRTLNLALRQYANVNGGQLPPDLAVLLNTGGISTDDLVCPSSEDERAPAPTSRPWRASDLTENELSLGTHLSYVYLGAGKNLHQLPPRWVVAYEETVSHPAGNGGAHLLCADGTVWFIPKARRIVDGLKLTG